jgi:hypothetical protein
MEIPSTPAVGLFGIFSLCLGWFLAVRKVDRAAQIAQITEERKKWRKDVRRLTRKVVRAYFTNKKKPIPKRVAFLRSKLATSLNPTDPADNAILDCFDILFTPENSDLKQFSKRIAFLLKQDWERVKWECMPLWVKPFCRFTRKQREWRREDYRKLW